MRIQTNLLQLSVIVVIKCQLCDETNTGMKKKMLDDQVTILSMCNTRDLWVKHMMQTRNVWC